MGKIIAIVNQKGGVGKTTTTVNLGAALALENKKVLLIDFDQQANATVCLGYKREEIKVDITDFLINDRICEEAILATEVNNLSIIPSSLKVAELNDLLHSFPQKKLLLEQKLQRVKNNFDFILIDCPPSLGVEVDNALYTADSVIIPVECGFYAYDAIDQMVKKINEVQAVKDLEIEGILITKLDNRSTFSYDIVEKVRFMFPDKTFKTMITSSSHIQEAPMHKKSVIQFSYNSRGSKEYRTLAQEIISRGELNE